MKSLALIVWFLFTAFTVSVNVVMKNGDVITGITQNDVESYRGIPFVEKPVGNLRFKPSVPYQGSLNGFQATHFGNPCHCLDSYEIMDYLAKLVPFAGWSSNPKYLNSEQSEDCLRLNVYRPTGLSRNAKLPVMVWVYGGAFQFGSTMLYPGDRFIQDSVELNEPVIYVSLSYRVGPWGFLGGYGIGAENSTNAAMWDLINGFKWIKENIEAFNGDKNRITAFGESSGAMLLSHLMITKVFKQDPLFNAVILQSGGLLPLSHAVTSQSSNKLFWKFSNAAGCQHEGNQTEALACLRQKNSKVLARAHMYDHSLRNSFDFATLFTVWGPKPDGILWDENSFVAAQNLVDIPIIAGCLEDEGTLIAFAFLTTSTEKFANALHRIFPYARDILSSFLSMYPQNPAEGAPFRTGPHNELWPNFKWLSAILTDLIFTMPRRIMLKYGATPTRKSPLYTFFADPLHNRLPFLGSTHYSDISYQFYATESFPSNAYRKYFISFANHYNPNTNNGGLQWWPLYDDKEKLMLHIGRDSGDIIQDTFRGDRTDFAMRNLSFWETY
ncbi:uncharacterized protein SAPINGB_P004109 [Magnusiomyces paraingens]|uniref:Carboxylesterase type B domain-containing protein n=1 Tax=Magnusiomyces paraingens TaxID=2606893 RepID=A0A5E8C080_9ASCO|nr:uncharacterized protein SAPINGB_P004109 [Saprochaete ingens]VVT54505.1 unnamed protein product [Saprochaete ingens]